MARDVCTMLGGIIGLDSISKSPGYVCGVIDGGQGQDLGSRARRRSGTEPSWRWDPCTGPAWSWDPRRPRFLVCRCIHGHDCLCKLAKDRKLPITPCLVFSNPSQDCSPPRPPPSAPRCPLSRGCQPPPSGRSQRYPRLHFHSFPLSSARTASSLSSHRSKWLPSKFVGAHEGQNTNHHNAFENEGTVFLHAKGACPVRRYSSVAGLRVESSSLTE